MFSKVVLKYMQKTVEDGYKWGCLPYQWDNVNSKIVIANSPLRKFLWYFNITVYTTYIVYLSLRTVQRQLDDSSLETRTIDEYALLIYILGFIARWCIFFRYEELLDFLNSFAKFYYLDLVSVQLASCSKPRPRITMKQAGHLIAKQLRRGGSRPNSIYATVEALKIRGDSFGWTGAYDSCFTWVFRIGSSIRWLDVIQGLTRPELDHCLTSLSSHPASIPFWQRFLLILPHVYIWWTNWAVLNLIAVHGLAYIRATLLTINYAKNLPLRGAVMYKRFCQVYRSMQLLQKKQNDGMGLFVTSAKCIMTYQAIRSFVIVLTHLERIGELTIVVILGCGSWACLHYVFTLLGQIFEESQQCLFRWKGRVAPRWFKQFLRSCWCLKIHIGEDSGGSVGLNLRSRVTLSMPNLDVYQR